MPDTLPQRTLPWETWRRSLWPTSLNIALAESGKSIAIKLRIIFPAPFQTAFFQSSYIFLTYFQ